MVAVMKIGGVPTQADFHEAISARSDRWYSACLNTWIHRIAINAALNQIRKSKPGVFEPLESDIESNLAAPHQILEEHELEHDLARSLERLSEVERVCFILKHLEQWRVKEISAELNLNEGRIKQAVFRAVKKLRVSMQDMQREDDERT